MGGIAGCYGSRDERTIRRMLDALAHQGPTEQGIHSTTKMVWGQSSPADRAEQSDQQPIVNEDSSTGVIASGEIYNSQSIRQRLGKKYPFQTHNDSEVILALYDQRGPDGVRDLDGMFALALFDEKRDTFVLARDPLGIKPLYYGYCQDIIYFSSERTVLGLAGVDEVQEFPAGHYYTPADGFIRYYRLPEVDKRPLVNAASIGLRIRKVLTRAVNKRLSSTPGQTVGALCSGDLAGAVVAALAARQLEDFHTFAVGWRDQDGKASADVEAARLTAAHIGSQHHELVYGPQEYGEALAGVIARLASYEPAVIRPAVAWFLASKLAADYVGVVLSGAGADELFAGYHYMQELALAKVNEECRRCIGELQLQEAEQLALYFNLEMRLPFVDKEMISLAMKIPADLKLKEQGNGSRVSKWIFCQAFADSDLLPQEILWRAELPRLRPNGAQAVAAQVAEAEIDQEELARLRHDHPAARIDSKEAALYFKIFQDLLP